MIVINFLGGPGCGKSTVCADVFAKLKWNNINCEIVTEYAKDAVWEESFKLLENQIGVFGEQHKRLHRLKDKVDVVVTDSPLLLSLLYYRGDYKYFVPLVKEVIQSFDNIFSEKSFFPRAALVMITVFFSPRSTFFVARMV